MYYLTRPSIREIDAFIDRARSTEFSYPYIGETEKGFKRLPKRRDATSFNVDHNRLRIGQGDEDWEMAKNAVRNWKMFEMPWVSLCWPDTLIEEDQTVAVLIHHFGFYSLNAARIVYVIDKWDRFGFAYGTLADHGESGEERFLVHIDRETKEVWYDLYAFSRPNFLLAKLGYLLARNLQKRFAADSKCAMLSAVNSQIML
jgi:uncharacterized protein (UPF0548 family)